MCGWWSGGRSPVCWPARLWAGACTYMLGGRVGRGRSSRGLRVTGRVGGWAPLCDCGAGWLAGLRWAALRWLAVLAALRCAGWAAVAGLAGL